MADTMQRRDFKGRPCCFGEGGGDIPKEVTESTVSIQRYGLANVRIYAVSSFAIQPTEHDVDIYRINTTTEGGFYWTVTPKT